LNLKAFFNFHTANGAIATLAVQNRNSSRYFLFDEGKNLCGWENVKTGEKRITRSFKGELTRFAFSGIHSVNKDLLSLMPSKSVFSIIDFYLEIAERHQITYFEHSETPFIDLGKIENLKDAEKYLDNLKG